MIPYQRARDKIRIKIGQAHISDYTALIALHARHDELMLLGYDLLKYYDYDEDSYRYLEVFVFFPTEEEAAIFKLTHL